MSGARTSPKSFNTFQMQDNLTDSDDDEFPDIDELLSGMKKRLASADLNSGNIAETVDNGTRRDSLPDSSCSANGSTQDPIVLSEDESTDAESEIYTNPNVDLTANIHPDSSHDTDSENGDSFGSRASLTSHCLVADYQDENGKNSGDNNQLRLSAGTIAPTRLACTAAALRSSVEPQSLAEITAPGREIVDDSSADDSDDEDCNYRSDATGFPCRSRKTKDAGNSNAVVHPTHSPDISRQALEETSYGSIQESKEFPIHGYFSRKKVGSKIMYCLTYSRESPPLSQSQGQGRDSPTDPEEPQSAASITDPTQEWEIDKITDEKWDGGERYLLVEWKKTWVRQSELDGAKELVDDFLAKVGTVTGKRRLAGHAQNGEGKRRRPGKRT